MSGLRDNDVAAGTKPNATWRLYGPNVIPFPTSNPTVTKLVLR